MGKVIIKTGDQFGMFTIIKEVEMKIYNCGSKKRQFLCRCNCGAEKKIAFNDIRTGNTKSCGCARADTAGKKNPMYKHGMKGSKIYERWAGMLYRCNPKFKDKKELKNYAGKGVTVCEEWKTFTVFYEWAINNGYKRGLTIERKNSNGNYEPCNCTWIPGSEQWRTRSTTKRFAYKGEMLTIVELSKKYNIPCGRLRHRISRYKWPIDRAINEPGEVQKKLTITKVRLIKLMLSMGETGAFIGRHFGINRSYISAIKRGRYWRDVL